MKLGCIFLVLLYFVNVESKPVSSKKDADIIDARKIHLERPRADYELSLNGIAYVQSSHLSVFNDLLNKLKMIEVLIKLSDSFCGGTIISDKFILTAAHCFVTRDHCKNDESTIKASILPPNKIQVFIEGICHSNEDTTCDKNDEGRAIAAKNIYILTEYYKNGCTSGDLAIIELEEVIGDHGAKLSVDQSLPQNGSFMVSGFGYDPIETAATNHMLKTVTLAIQKCATDQGYPDSICTEEMDKNICKGDSGGALIDEQNIIYGVVSSGTSCQTIYSSMLNREADKQDYKKWTGGVFTATSRHLGFICEIIGDFESCPKTFTKEPFLQI